MKPSPPQTVGASGINTPLQGAEYLCKLRNKFVSWCGYMENCTYPFAQAARQRVRILLSVHHLCSKPQEGVRRTPTKLCNSNPDCHPKSPIPAAGRIEKSPARPSASSVDTEQIPFQERSACEPHRQWIEQQIRLGRNTMSIYQEKRPR